VERGHGVILWGGVYIINVSRETIQKNDTLEQNENILIDDIPVFSKLAYYYKTV